MQSPHTLRTLLLWVLAWFFVALGVAVASPLVSPQGMELLCSGPGAGGAQLVVKTANGPVAADTPGLDCPLCLVADTPLLTTLAAARTATSPTSHNGFATPHFARAEAAISPPARAPPLFN